MRAGFAAEQIGVQANGVGAEISIPAIFRQFRDFGNRSKSSQPSLPLMLCSIFLLHDLELIATYPETF